MFGALVLWVALLAHTVAVDGFPAVGDFNSAEVPLPARRWVRRAASLGNNSNAQLQLAHYLYFAPRRFAEDDENDENTASKRETAPSHRRDHDSGSDSDSDSYSDGTDGGGDAGNTGRNGYAVDILKRRQARRRHAAKWYAKAAALGEPEAQSMVAAFHGMGCLLYTSDAADE